MHITEPVDQAGGATRAPTASLAASEPTLILSDSGASELGSSSGVGDLEDAQEQQDITIDENHGHGPGANVARDVDCVNTQDAAPIVQHVQDVRMDLSNFVAEFSVPAVPQQSGAIVQAAAGDPFITAFAFILHFLIACITLVCYIAVATALFSRFER